MEAATVNPNKFVMQGVRSILEEFNLTDSNNLIVRQLNIIERAVEDDPDLAISISRNLIETCLKTILTDRKKCKKDFGMKDLLENTYSELLLVPESHMEDGSLHEKMQSFIDNMIQGVSDLRHICGMSHGRDAYSQASNSCHAKLVASTADTVVCFLFSIHKEYPFKRCDLIYEENKDFNDYIDNSNEVSILAEPYAASKVLFEFDKDAYIQARLDYESALKSGLLNDQTNQEEL